MSDEEIKVEYDFKKNVFPRYKAEYRRLYK